MLRSVSQVLVTIFGPETAPQSAALARELRQGGVACELFPSDRVKMGKQFRHAERLGIRYVAVVGPDELSAGQVAIKDLAEREQVTVPRAEAAAEVLKRLR